MRDGPSGGLWETLLANRGTVTSFVTNPQGFILGIVIPALISILILTPLRYGIGFIEWAGAMVQGTFTIIETQVAGAFEPVSAAILGSDRRTGVIEMAYGGVEATLMDAGLGAPIAASITAVVFAAVLTVVVYVLLRVTLDAVPGGGGLLP